MQHEISVLSCAIIKDFNFLFLVNEFSYLFVVFFNFFSSSIQLPKHKSVVVTLNDSDDSESDGEPSNSTNSVFGGLESMIKEARRNVEVNYQYLIGLFCNYFALFTEFKLLELNQETIGLHQKRARVDGLLLSESSSCNLHKLFIISVQIEGVFN